MADIRRLDGLEIDDDADFQRKDWALRRVGWVVLGVLILGALLGVFGDGVLSQASATDAAGRAQVKYQRFGPYQAPFSVELQVTADAAPGGEVRVWLSREYADAMSAQRVVPEPASVVAEGDRLVYVFKASRSSAPLEVAFHFRPNAMGNQTGRVGLTDGPELAVRHFIYP